MTLTLRLSNTIRAVLLDMDGLLLDTERLSFRCWSQASQEFGYALSESLFGRMIGRPVQENEAMVLAELGSDFPYWEVRKRRVFLMDEEIRANGVPKRLGSSEIVAFFQSRGLPMAVVTSTAGADARQRLAQADLLSAMEFVIGPEDVQRGKPDPECYRLAASRLGVDVEECLVLEDSPAGVKAGIAAGMQVIWVPDFAQISEELRQGVVGIANSLLEVPEALSSEILR